MPIYECHCDKCDREVTLTLTIREHETGEIKCPKCGGTSLRPLFQRLHVSNIEEILIVNESVPNLSRVASAARSYWRLETRGVATATRY
jgi:putative FmdB family regulatory protein